MIDETKIENSIRSILGNDVSVISETAKLSGKAQGVVRLIIENGDDSLLEPVEELGTRMQGVTVIAQCSSREDNPELAKEMAAKLRVELPAKIQDDSLFFLNDYLESEGVNLEEGRFVESAVFDGGHTL